MNDIEIKSNIFIRFIVMIQFFLVFAKWREVIDHRLGIHDNPYVMGIRGPEKEKEYKRGSDIFIERVQ